jgi:uncharacterized protein YbjT (DUF2867 family)
MMTPSRGHAVLVNGATGYIGSHLLAPLVEAGYRVRAAARHPERVRAPDTIDVVAADATDPRAVRAALDGMDTAYYLVHTLGAGADYAERDRSAARVFGQAARDAGLRRIVYLGGLGAEGAPLSDHLASRHEVGRVLAESGVPVIEFRASIVIGSGSTSFEMIRNLVEKLPVMTTPRWVRVKAQPIAVDDVIDYLTAAAELELAPDESHRVYEIGGADADSYGELLQIYAGRRGLRRLVIPIPVLSPGLSGWWLYLFTPRQATVGRQLAESLRFPTTVTDARARRDFPSIAPMGTEAAIDKAFADEDAAFAGMQWAEELAGIRKPSTFEREGRYVDSRCISTDCRPEAAFGPVACIGGKNGWYAFDTLWDLRGFVDTILGGPGRRRGRRDQDALVEGDHLEWWRVERVVPPRLLRLRAEMVMPGRGWLQYEFTPEGEGTIVRQTAVFDAKGVLGRLYWHAIAPFHHFVFNGTLRGIATRCRAPVEGPDTCPLPPREYGQMEEQGKPANGAGTV